MEKLFRKEIILKLQPPQFFLSTTIIATPKRAIFIKYIMLHIMHTIARNFHKPRNKSDGEAPR